MSAEKPLRRKITAREAAERFGVTTRTIQRVMAEPREDFLARAKERRERVLALRDQGFDYKAIAAQTGDPVGTVARLLHEARKREAPPPPPPATAAEAAADARAKTEAAAATAAHLQATEAVLAQARAAVRAATAKRDNARAAAREAAAAAALAQEMAQARAAAEAATPASSSSSRCA